jgi:pyruvate dehydrogenase E1 component alpha subunit
VVFICENNLWMEYTRTSEVTAVVNPAADRASAYGLQSIIVDGNDADAVYEIARAAVERARAGGGPSLIEAKTYRHGGHSRADPGKYRPDDELAEWMAKDPIPLYRNRLLDAGVSEEDLAAIEFDVRAQVDAATEEAKAGGIPGEDLLMKDLWADGGSSWRN